MELDLDVMGKIAASLDGIHGHMKRQTALLQRLSDAPSDQFFRSQASSAGSGDLIFPFPSAVVELGYCFVAKRWSVGGNDVTDTRAGTAYLMQSASIPAYLDATQTVATLGSLFNVGYFSGRQLVINQNEALWVGIEDPTASSQYNVTIAGELYKIGGYQASIEL